MSHSYLVTCQYRKCGAQTIRKSPRQKYCNLTCSNREQYEKYKERSKIESASTAALHEAVPTAAHTIHNIDDLPGVQVDPSKDTEDFLRSFKESNPASGPDPAIPPTPAVSRPTVVTGEEIAKAKKQAEEDMLIARYKAQRKRERILAKAKEALKISDETATTKSNDELLPHINRWVEKDGEPDV